MLGAVLRLEYLGHDSEAYCKLYSIEVEHACGKETADLFRTPSRRPWVAEITGRDPKYGLARRFLRGRTDYSESNSIGSRGVCLEFELEDGKMYEVREQVSWSRSERYFVLVKNGMQLRYDREEVDEWLREQRQEQRHG